MGKAFDDPAVERLIKAAEGNPRAMINLARTLLLPRKMEASARELCAKALSISGNDPELTALAQMVTLRKVERFYFNMVKDENRNALYTKALQKLLKPGSHVLDIGAGTGLFAMLAARAGAASVTACECNLAVAEAASHVIDQNGLSETINLVAKKSQQLEIGVDMAKRADVLIWDNLANNLLGAGGQETLQDARQRLLKPGAIILPGRVEICAALAEHQATSDRVMGDVDGFDLSPFNSLLNKPTTTNQGFTLRSEPVTLFDLDFQSGKGIVTGASRQITQTLLGPVNGIVQWLRFHLSEDLVYDTSGKDVYAFGQKFHPTAPFETTEPQDLQICGNHDGNAVWLWLEDA